MTPVGKRLMTSSVELDEFIASERAKAVEAEEQQTLRNWIALSGRAETVSEKVSCSSHDKSILRRKSKSLNNPPLSDAPFNARWSSCKNNYRSA